MAGRVYYYNLGGGNSPKNWIAWAISFAIFAGLVAVLLPVIGVLFAVVLAGGVVMAAAGCIFRWWAMKKLEKELARREEAETRRAAQPDDGTPASAGSKSLEIREAIVVSETERKTRR